MNIQGIEKRLDALLQASENKNREYYFKRITSRLSAVAASGGAGSVTEDVNDELFRFVYYNTNGSGNSFTVEVTKPCTVKIIKEGNSNSFNVWNDHHFDIFKQELTEIIKNLK